MQTYDRLFIGGDWVTPAGTGTIDVVNPATEAVVGTVPEASPGDMDRAVAAARRAFDEGPWPTMTPSERAAVLTKVSQAIQADMQPMAELIATEMGSPVSWATMAQVLAPTMIFDYYAGLAADHPFEEVRQGLMGQVLVRSEPVGVVAAITPWNVPLFLAAAKLAPALVAGCTVVFKPAPETPLDAFRLAELFAEAGLPEGVLSVVPAGREVGEHLVRHRGVDKVSFTGSTAAGRTIGAICGEQLKRVSLELGGKSAAVLLDDVDLAQALPMLLPNALMNNGEACIAQTRIVAPRHRYQEVVDALVEQVSAMKVGDPLDPHAYHGSNLMLSGLDGPSLDLVFDRAGPDAPVPLLAATPAADRVQGQVGRRRARPRHRMVGAVRVGETPAGPDHPVLGHVLREAGVPHDVPGDAPHHGVVGAEEPLEPLGRRRRDVSHERLHGHHLSRTAGPRVVTRAARTARTGARTRIELRGARRGAGAHVEDPDRAAPRHPAASPTLAGRGPSCGGAGGDRTHDQGIMSPLL